MLERWWFFKENVEACLWKPQLKMNVIQPNPEKYIFGFGRKLPTKRRSTSLEEVKPNKKPRKELEPEPSSSFATKSEEEEEK